MATLSGSSTVAEIVTEIKESSTYEEEGSLSLCRRFITAVRMYLLTSPAQSSQQGVGGLSLPVVQLEKQLEQAKQWLVANGGATNPNPSSSVVHADFARFRS